jgi:hypothetical protein
MAVYACLQNDEAGCQPMAYDAVNGKPLQNGRQRRMGRLKTAGLNEEQAFSIQHANRYPRGDFSILRSLAPERLASVLNDVKRGECPAEYLKLAQDIELRDLRYRSALSARKDAVTRLEIKIIPASEDKRGAELADYIGRDIAKNAKAKLRVPISLTRWQKVFPCAKLSGTPAGRDGNPPHTNTAIRAGFSTAGKPERGLSSAPRTAHSTHILPALEMLRISLSGPPKRRKQPKHYL